jgi:hypothetical protein
MSVTVAYNKRNEDGEFPDYDLKCSRCGNKSQVYIQLNKCYCKSCLTDFINMIDEAILEM